jgi:murein DD-endopeptidase MepM/ murein hydrolase activator NlpD
VRAPFFVLILTALVATLVSSAAAASAGRASASAVAALVRVPGQSDAVLGAAAAPPGAQAALGAGTLAGGAVSLRSGTASVQTGPGAAPRASASVDVRGLSLLGGEITAQRAAGVSVALAGEGEPGGNFGGSLLEGLAVAGSPVEGAPNSRIELGDWGYVVVLEQAVLREDGNGPGYRGFVSALHVYLTKDHGGLPAGAEILVGYAEAAVRGEPVEETAPPAEGAETAPPDSEQTPPLEREPMEPPPGSQDEGPPPIVRDPPAEIRPDITGRGYVFPVYGHVGYSDDFAAPRADTIWHHGNDIFATTGAPVLAVTRGELFLVGWNTLGGHRLWLRDDAGNEYYYAHLSAYSPLAVDGARVEAGDVIGFVGQSGASGGVPHLHFEIHPSALLGLGYDGVINPYTYLLAWQALRDREFGIAPPALAGGSAPEAGAVLLDAHDISTASGLDAAALERALALPAALGNSDDVLARPPDLIGAPLGFPG